MYNPPIMGYSNEQGPIRLPLRKAKELYDQYPSKFNILRNNETRNVDKTLNLLLGYKIKNLLEEEKGYLDRHVFNFYQTWHRDYYKEFGIKIAALHNITDYQEVSQLLEQNKHYLEHIEKIDLKTELINSSTIRKSTINSIQGNSNSFTQK